MIHDLQWFKDRIGSFVKRGTTEIEIKSEEVAEKLFKIQSNNYTFDDKPDENPVVETTNITDPFADSKIRIHRKKGPPEECESCSA